MCRLCVCVCCLATGIGTTLECRVPPSTTVCNGCQDRRISFEIWQYARRGLNVVLCEILAGLTGIGQRDDGAGVHQRLLLDVTALGVHVRARGCYDVTLTVFYGRKQDLLKSAPSLYIYIYICITFFSRLRWIRSI